MGGTLRTGTLRALFETQFHDVYRFELTFSYDYGAGDWGAWAFELQREYGGVQDIDESHSGDFRWFGYGNAIGTDILLSSYSPHGTPLDWALQVGSAWWLVFNTDTHAAMFDLGFNTWPPAYIFFYQPQV